ncbi:signal transducer and activator of transcription 1-alpha/beta-like isoform X2 [Mya arenaria]|uniref:signal transducer and activator of transcription 1-alpha/beta-like isoform X2 n=1 Tax=Mya arenaria TaxID=6604 RepID=UPI0022E69B74|nr:signal transducer and activator of transcription 1-alpha/beta-like isoform X2 [Mya arenaria]
MDRPQETDEWGSDGENQPVGIVAFMQKNHERAQALHTEWDKMLKELDVDLFLRSDMDSWFQKCFVIKCNQNDIQAYKAKLIVDFVKEMKTKIEHSREGGTANGNNNASMANFLQRQRALIQLEQQISDGTVVDMAVTCITREQDLIMAMFPSERPDELSFHLTNAIKLKECLVKAIDDLTKGRHGDSSSENEVLQIALEKFEECGRLLCSIQEILPELTRTLGTQIEEWKQQFKLQYAELYADANVEPIAKRSSEIWGFLQELRTIVVEQLSVLVDEDTISRSKQTIDKTAIDLIKGTFLVTDQSIYVLKQGKKNSPDSLFTVRILAAEMTDLLKSLEVKAYLLYDGDLNDCWNEHKLDLQMVNDRCKKVKGQLSVKFAKENRGRFEATFTKLTLERIKRPNSEKPVHEEKYRFVFVATFEKNVLWTVSLPLVIVTATNQQCHAMASIMWECFSTNVFQLPISVPVELPWSTIAKMLNAKIRRLCPSRELTDDNVRHLKLRLIGDNEPDDTSVTLKKFCFDRMPQLKIDANGNEQNKDKSFSFWQWFMACYNLIDKHLLKYWQHGWIYGFISKKEATLRLMALKKPEIRDGLFLLRFSDNEIVESQGVSGMFAYLRSTKMKLIYNENKLKKREIYNFEVAGPKDLKRNELANILKYSMELDNAGGMETQYLWLFPQMVKREETFDSHLTLDQGNPGYDGKTQTLKLTTELPQRVVRLLEKHPCPPDVDLKSSVSAYGASAKHPRISEQSSFTSPLTALAPLSNVGLSSNTTTPVSGCQYQSQQNIPKLPAFSQPFNLSHQTHGAHTIPLDSQMSDAFGEENQASLFQQTENIQMQKIVLELSQLSVEKRTKVIQHFLTQDGTLTLLNSGLHAAVGNTVEIADIGASFISDQYEHGSSCPDPQQIVTPTASNCINDLGISTSEPEISCEELEQAIDSGNIETDFWDRTPNIDI